MVKETSLVLAALGLLCAGPAVQAADPIEGLARTCNNCHGVDGVSAGGAMPSIGGQSEAYLKHVMMEWKSGASASATMTRLIKGYSDEQIAALAKYYAGKTWRPVVQAAGADVLAQGKDATNRCETCHGATGGEPDEDDTPRLNGQQARYLELELMKYRDDGFTMTHKKMLRNARRMDEGDITTAARFYGSQSK